MGKKGKNRKKIKKKEGGGFSGVEERGYWGGQNLILITLDRHECFQCCITCKRTNNANNATHYVKLGKKRIEFQVQLLHYLSKSDIKSNFHHIFPCICRYACRKRFWVPIFFAMVGLPFFFDVVELVTGVNRSQRGLSFLTRARAGTARLGRVTQSQY